MKFASLLPVVAVLLGAAPLLCPALYNGYPSRGGTRARSGAGPRPPAVARLTVFAGVAYTVNAVPCGNLSGVLDRFGARALWLLALGPFALACEWLDRRRANEGAVKSII